MRRFMSPRWMARHVAMIVLVVAFIALGWWQIRRATGGNALSFGYAVEWPVFALFVIFVWYREIRNELRGGEPEAPRLEEPVLRVTLPVASHPVVETAPEDPELTAYNDYLAWLNADPDRRPSDYRRARAVGMPTQPPG
jgi:DNA-binding transcriptional regulator of glucitol operon